MGIDRHEYVRQACPCGEGRLEVDYCLADHPWAKPDSGNFQLRLECETCSNALSFIQQNSEAVLVKKSEIHESEQEIKKLYERGKAIEKSDLVRQYLDEFVTLLEATKTDTNKYRRFQGAGFHMQSLPTFRKTLKQEALSRLVHRSFSFHHLPALIAVLGQKNPDLVTEVENINERLAELRTPYVPVAEPVCTLTAEAFYGRIK